jgi:amidase
MNRREIIAAGGTMLLAEAMPAAAIAGGAARVQPDPITDLTAVELSRAIHSRRISCREIMAAYLRRIERINPRHLAIVMLRDPEVLLAEADAADASLRAHGPSGPLHGFPLAPKDSTVTAGLPSRNGMRVSDPRPATADGIIAERMRRAGGIFIGKTNMPELGLGSQSYNTIFGTTLNAWNPSLTAGGSSGGAAVAVAQRLVPLADGSDLMGSLRNPAGWNNIAALRPSAGRVPYWPGDVFQTLPTEGPMGRTVADIALLLSIQAGHDPRSPLSLSDAPGQFANGLDRDFRGVRIGWLRDLNGYLPTEPGVLELCDKAVRSFEAIGGTVESPAITFDMASLWDCWVTLRSHMLAAAAAPLYRDPALREQLKPELVWEIETGLSLSAERIGKAAATRNAWFRTLSSLFAQHDFLVLPTAQVFPFDARVHWPTQVGGRTMDTYHRWMEVAALGTLTGLPIAAVPAGFASSRRAMGLQIIGPPQADHAVLQIARSYEEATGFSRRRPDA